MRELATVGLPKPFGKRVFVRSVRDPPFRRSHHGGLRPVAHLQPALRAEDLHPLVVAVAGSPGEVQKGDKPAAKLQPHGRLVRDVRLPQLRRQRRSRGHHGLGIFPQQVADVVHVVHGQVVENIPPLFQKRHRGHGMVPKDGRDGPHRPDLAPDHRLPQLAVAVVEASLKAAEEADAVLLRRRVRRADVPERPGHGFLHGDVLPRRGDARDQVQVRRGGGGDPHGVHGRIGQDGSQLRGSAGRGVVPLRPEGQGGVRLDDVGQGAAGVRPDVLHAQFAHAAVSHDG
mmetsp:Transcript_107/g.230  ORF Transcript_107/g.230 Transcript_107/m.230 type:complete len:286 (+) Transcript_107:422-1279(+)